MLSRLLPSRIDNRFRGHPAALWIFAPIVLLDIAISLGAIFNPDGGAQSADGIPLDTYGPAAARAVIGVAAYLGVSDLLLGVVFILAMVRYRAMIPLMYALLVARFLAHRGVGLMKPIARIAGTSTGSTITWVVFALCVAGLALSLTGRGYRPSAAGDEA